MPDSLLFDGDGGVGGDYRDFSAGAIAGSGALSIAAIVKPTVAFSGYDFLLNWSHSGGTPSAGFMLLAGVTAIWNGSTERAGGTIPAIDEWYLVGMSRATGTTTPRWHIYRYSTSGPSHGAFAGTMGNFPACTNTRWMWSAGEAFAGNLLLAGVWDSELSDGSFETLATGGLAAWVTAAPDECWRFNTAGAITPTVGTSTQTDSQSETLDVGDAPAGWSDTLGGGASVAITPSYALFPKRKLRRA